MGGKNETQRVGGCVYTGLCSQPQGPGLDFSIGLSPAKVMKTRGNGAGKVEARTCYSKFRKSYIWGRDSVPFSATGPPSSLDLTGNQHGVAARKIRGPHGHIPCPSAVSNVLVLE